MGRLALALRRSGWGLVAIAASRGPSGQSLSFPRRRKASPRPGAYRPHRSRSDRSDGGTRLLTILLSGYSSLGAIVSALIAPFYVWWFKPQYTFPVSMLSCLILLRHHDNIQRLWRRQESKIWTRMKKKKRQSRNNLPSRPRLPGGSLGLFAHLTRTFAPRRHDTR